MDRLGSSWFSSYPVIILKNTLSHFISFSTLIGVDSDCTMASVIINVVQPKYPGRGCTYTLYSVIGAFSSPYARSHVHIRPIQHKRPSNTSHSQVRRLTSVWNHTGFLTGYYLDQCVVVSFCISWCEFGCCHILSASFYSKVSASHVISPP